VPRSKAVDRSRVGRSQVPGLSLSIWKRRSSKQIDFKYRQQNPVSPLPFLKDLRWPQAG
jgi:hypothetical protein